MKQYRSEKAGNEILRTYNELLGQWNIAYEELDLTSAFGVTHVIAAGDASLPPLVLFHGVGDDSALMWLYNAASLAKRFRLYAVDTIGGPGKSRMGAGYCKGFDDAQWVDTIFDGLSLSDAFVVGVSNGGYLTQLYALSRPQRVRKAVCISASVPAGESGSSMKAMMKIFMPEALFPTKRNVAKLIRKLSGDHADVFTDNPTIMEHYRWLLKGFNNMAMSCHSIRRFTPAEIDVIRPKITYLCGESDPFQTLGGRRVLDENHMNARFYPGAGHGLNHELAADINAVLPELLING